MNASSHQRSGLSCNRRPATEHSDVKTYMYHCSTSYMWVFSIM
uniref:Uncharacterized protein n=1 Tax=Arundo donax TaxID=35708 RepID=A0A0A9EB20_ARUDO